MNNVLRKLLIIPVILLIHACNVPGGNENTVILIKTTLGDIRLRLYDSTPVHRDNFLRLLNNGTYNNVSFHRVIKDFMIQTGDPSTKPDFKPDPSDTLGTYTIPAEFNPSCYHKKGALAAARRGNDENPEMRSSGTQFYIVQGIRYTDPELDQAEKTINSNIKQAAFNRILKQMADSLRAQGKTPSDAEIQELSSIKMFDLLSQYSPYKFSEEQRNVYKTSGGVPRLDGTYTVFGEVIEGLDVVDRIASVSTDINDRPTTDVRILEISLTK